MSDKQIGEQVEKTIDCMKVGDLACVQNIIGSVQDQKRYMEMLPNEATVSALPDLKITYSTKEDNSSRYDSVGNKFMTVKIDYGNISDDKDDKLSVEENRSSWDKFLDTFKGDKKQDAPAPAQESTEKSSQEKAKPADSSQSEKGKEEVYHGFGGLAGQAEENLRKRREW